MNNYPPGVTAMHPHFNPPICPDCQDEFDGEKCDCGFEAPDKYDTPEGDKAFDAARDEGRLR